MGQREKERVEERGSNADMKNTQLESYVSCVSAVSASVYVFVVCVCNGCACVCVRCPGSVCCPVNSACQTCLHIVHT